MLRKKPASTTSPIVFDHVSLSKRGPTLALSVTEGSTVAIVGPATSGKSKLIGCTMGEDRPERGKIELNVEVASQRNDEWTRRDKPQTLARNQGSNEIAAEGLSALGLWDVRQQFCLKLPPGQQNAARLIESLVSSAPLMVFDLALDDFDPWAIESLWSYLRVCTARGRTLIFSTNRADLAQRADHVIVLKANQLAFTGTPDALIRSVGPTHLTVSAEDQPGVKALTDSFDVAIEETADGTTYAAAEGQQLAAKLLLEGYGNVRYFVKRTPTFAEALLSLCS